MPKLSTALMGAPIRYGIALAFHSIWIYLAKVSFDTYSADCLGFFGVIWGIIALIIVYRLLASIFGENAGIGYFSRVIFFGSILMIVAAVWWATTLTLFDVFANSILRIELTDGALANWQAVEHHYIVEYLPNDLPNYQANLVTLTFILLMGWVFTTLLWILVAIRRSLSGRAGRTTDVLVEGAGGELAKVGAGFALSMLLEVFMPGTGGHHDIPISS